MPGVTAVTDQSLLRIRGRAVVRRGMLWAGRPFARVLVNEFPKSGGSWLAKMLASGLSVDFPQNVLPTRFPAVFHGHYMSRYPRVPKVILWRDPRDVMVSWYYHCLFENERNNHGRVQQNRERLGFSDADDITKNLPAFIDWCFSGQGEPHVNWAQFHDFWSPAREDAVHTTYESLRSDPVAEMGRLLTWLGTEMPVSQLEALVDEFSFSRQSNRQAGTDERSSFLRKGIVGDWVNAFDQSGLDRLQHHLGPRLEKYSSGFPW